MVLLKGHGSDGFVFYTNAESRKGEQILANGRAALLFHWKSLRRQVRIEGPLDEVTEAEADAYFHSRPRVSQIGSAASDQSRPLPDRQVYLDRVRPNPVCLMPSVWMLSVSRQLVSVLAFC